MEQNLQMMPVKKKTKTKRNFNNLKDAFPALPRQESKTGIGKVKQNN